MTHAGNIDSADGWSPSGLLAAGIAAVAVVYALIGVIDFPASMILVLGASVSVATICGRYETSIPGTAIKLKPKDLMAFWGVIWLGVPGGVLIGLAASLAEKPIRPELARRGLSISIDVISCFVSAIVFSLVLSAFGSEAAMQKNPGAGLISADLIGAACLLGFTHFGTRSALRRIFGEFLEKENSYRKTARSFVSTAASYSVHVFATIVLFLVFSHFGIEFGLVVIPLVVVGHIAYKIHTRTLEAKTRQLSEASRLHLSTVEALATAIDARDQVGMGHVRRTQIYALGIGKVLGLPENDLNALRMGALLHDIGKLAVPDHILNKPGRLTPAEFEKTKIHSSVGSSILETIRFPYPVVPTVKYHHEHWDGTGYPEGLRGSMIPLTARILTVADVYDTLRGARPYRSAVPAAKAMETLRENAGKKFDPAIVEILVENLAEFEREIISLGLGYEAGTDSGAFMISPADIEANHSFVQHIKRANREVFTLYSLAKEFGAAADLEESLSLLTEKIGELAPYDTCAVYLMDKSGEFAVARHVAGANRKDLLSKQVVPGEGATGYVLKAHQPVQNVDPALDFAFSDAEFSRDYIAMASLPLVADEAIVGAVSLYSRTVACYGDEHIRLLDTVSKIATDAIVRSQQLAEAETYALTDPMTGLPNSRGLQDHFDREAKRADRSDSGFQLLVLDLDGFKTINDTHGHKIGDTMLREIANVIKGQLREYDFLARYGGDEFVAIIPNAETIDVLELSRRIERSVSEFEMDLGNGETASVGVSIGAASYPAQGETFDQVIVAADKAMYITKAIHRQERRSDKRHRTQAEGAGLEDPVRVTADKLRPGQLPKTVTDDGILIELDDRHIISSSAVN